jgi:Family of unknown function (DUF6527)
MVGILVGKKIYKPQDSVVMFECPGCGGLHQVFTDYTHRDKEGKVIHWEWNGDGDKPTISPSVLVSKDDPKFRCHSWVREGRIEFLSDCFHDLKGKTVDLPDWD